MTKPETQPRTWWITDNTDNSGYTATDVYNKLRHEYAVNVFHVISYEAYEQSQALVLKYQREMERLVEALKFECGGRCAAGINPCNALDVITDHENFLRGIEK